MGILSEFLNNFISLRIVLQLLRHKFGNRALDHEVNVEQMLPDSVSINGLDNRNELVTVVKNRLSFKHLDPPIAI